MVVRGRIPDVMRTVIGDNDRRDVASAEIGDALRIVTTATLHAEIASALIRLIEGDDDCSVAGIAPRLPSA